MTATRADRGAPRVFHVYVVELDHKTLASAEQCVYVGETGLTPAERYARHRAGGRTAARVVSRHGIRLRIDLAAGWGPYGTREAAVNAEAELAQSLRAQGYRVFGGQGTTFSMSDGATSCEPKASPRRSRGYAAHFEGIAGSR